MPPRPADWGRHFDVLRDVMFRHRMYMDLYEREVLTFIYGRTEMYGKQWEYISLRHFMHGIKTPDGDYVSSPVAMSRTKLLESLRHLKAKGYIEIKYGDSANCYRINDDIDAKHALQYMRRHQRKEYESILGRLHKDDVRQNIVQSSARVHAQTPVRQCNTWSTDGPEGGPDTDQRVVQERTNRIVPIIIQPNTNTAAPEGRSASLRKLTLRKKV